MMAKILVVLLHVELDEWRWKIGINFFFPALGNALLNRDYHAEVAVTPVVDSIPYSRKYWKQYGVFVPILNSNTCGSFN